MAKQTNVTASSKDVTPEMVGEWKNKYGDVFVVEAEGKKCWLRRPNRKVIGAAVVLSNGDPMEQKEVIIRNCWLGGDMEFQNEDRYFFALSGKVDEMVDIATASLKKA